MRKTKGRGKRFHYMKGRNYIIHLNRKKSIMYPKARIINLKGPYRGGEAQDHSP